MSQIGGRVLREERTRLRLTHERPDGALRHVFHSFGEDLWRLTREDRRWTVDIDETDRRDHGFEVVVRSPVLRRSIAFIDDLLSKHVLRGTVRVEIIEGD